MAAKRRTFKRSTPKKPIEVKKKPVKKKPQESPSKNVVAQPTGVETIAPVVQQPEIQPSLPAQPAVEPSLEKVLPEKEQPVVQEAKTQEDLPVTDELLAVDQDLSVDSPLTTSSDREGEKRGGSKLLKNLLFMLVIIVITAVITGVGFFLYFSRSQQEQANKKATATITPTEEVSPSATSTPKVALESKYSLQILNGSGTPGAAAKLQTALEDKGYTVGGVGNADKSTYTDTVIQIKKSVEKAYTNALVTLLTEKSYIATISSELKDSDTYDVIVVIGSKRTE